MQGVFAYTDFTMDFKRLRECLSAVFEVQMSDVLIVEGIITEMVGPNIAVVCEYRPVNGDFNFDLSIYFGVDLFEYDALAIFGRMADTLECRFFIDDGDISPYTGFIVSGLNVYTKVRLDADLLDEEELIIIK